MYIDDAGTMLNVPNDKLLCKVKQQQQQQQQHDNSNNNTTTATTTTTRQQQLSVHVENESTRI